MRSYFDPLKDSQLKSTVPDLFIKTDPYVPGFTAERFYSGNLSENLELL